MRVLELFGGIGACTKALKRLGLNPTVVDYVEIDKYAVASYNAINGTNFKPQDICEWDKDIEVDLIMHGSPCQDFSVAGLQHGGDENSGTRSSLMYESVRIISKLMPKYVLWENVKNVLSAKHRHNFDKYLDALSELGYQNFYQVLNAKDYGVPQNRERVFVVSILGGGEFKFSDKKELKLRLKDLLEDEADEKYYLNKQWHLSTEDVKHDVNEIAQIDGISYQTTRTVTDVNKICRCLSTMSGGQTEPKILVKEATKKGYQIAEAGDSINLQYPNSRTRRGRVGKQISQTLTTTEEMKVVASDYRIRKLTPLECWRLMGFDDEDCIKAAEVNSNTKLYKQAGNSIVVNVLEAIFKNLLGADANDY